MKKVLPTVLASLFTLVAFGLLILANAGFISLRKPYIYRYSTARPAAAETTTFVNVNVIPMDGERVLEGQTVIVHDGMIEAIGPGDQAQAPAGSLMVDGRGKYLMPGLVDMHVHIMNENDLLLFAANGVTTVRNMWGMTGASLAFGFPDQLVLREAIAAGEIFGPTIYTTGPVMEGKPKAHPMMAELTSPEAARASVAEQAVRGYDAIKVYDNLDSEVYRAILETAREQGLPVVGHAPFAPGLEGVLSGGQVTIEHLTGYLDPDAAKFTIPEEQLDAYAARTREAGVWNVPTLSLYPKNNVSRERQEKLERQPGQQYLAPARRAMNRFNYLQMSKTHSYAAQAAPGESYPERIAALNQVVMQALHRAGAGILLGTDALNPYQIPGYSAHEELVYLVQAGLTPYEALRAGTHDAALALGRLNEFGTVAEGKRADLLLLDANPLEDVAHSTQIAGVTLRGRWLARSELDSMLDGLKGSFKPSLVERLWPLVLLAGAVFALIQSIKSMRNG